MEETNLNQFKEVVSGGTFTLRNSSLAEGPAGRQRGAGEARPDGRLSGRRAPRPQGRGPRAVLQGGPRRRGRRSDGGRGDGDVFLAHNARKIMILDLEGEMMTVNGDNILAFEEGVDWDIVPLAGAGRPAGGAFNVALQGAGKVAVTAQEDPVLLDTNSPASADPDSAIAWSGRVRNRVKSDVSFNTSSSAATPVRLSGSPSRDQAGSLCSPRKARRCPRTPTPGKADPAVRPAA